jgi:hypothetical protein
MKEGDKIILNPRTNPESGEVISLEGDLIEIRMFDIEPNCGDGTPPNDWFIEGKFTHLSDRYAVYDEGKDRTFSFDLDDEFGLDNGLVC